MPEKIVCYGYGWSTEEDVGATYTSIHDLPEIIDVIIAEGEKPKLEFLSQDELLKDWELAVEDIKETHKVRGKPIFGINVKDERGGWGTLFVCFKKR